MLDPKNLYPRQEQHENYTCRVTKKRRYAYDYRAGTGKLFSCIAPTLKAAREKRDAWLVEKRIGGVNMKKPVRVKYVGDTTDPGPETIGTAVHANGFYDPESAEYLAWVFFPDESEIGYYCDESDLEFLPA